METHPARISGIGGRFAYDNAAEFPDTQQVTFEYAGPEGATDKKRLLVYEERLWSTNYPHNCDSGVEFYGTQGQMFLTRRGKIRVLGDRNRPVELDVPREPQNTTAHVADFIAAIRSGRRSSADIATGHLTTALCHLGNIATRLQRTLEFDGEQERFVGDAEADAMLVRDYRPGHWGAPQQAS